MSSNMHDASVSPAKTRSVSIRAIRGTSFVFLLIFLASAHGQKRTKAGYDLAARATVLHPTIVYVAPDDTSSKVAEVLPGHELVVIQHNGPWVKVFANTDAPDTVEDEPEFQEDENATPASGWIKDKGVVTPQTPAGDSILFGSAANLEDLAERPHAPKDAASEAHFLYRRVFEYFPTSNLAGESAFRSADIRWQLDKAANADLPSSHEQEAYLRPQLYEGDMKRVIKQFPGSVYAFEAAYDLLDNKLCGDWQGLPKCPETEASLYLKYAGNYPESPRAPEAMYNAIYRTGVLVTMYQVEDATKRAADAAKRTQDLTADMQSRFPNSDYTRRAQSIAFRVRQGVSIYGNDRE